MSQRSLSNCNNLSCNNYFVANEWFKLFFSVGSHFRILSLFAQNFTVRRSKEKMLQIFNARQKQIPRTHNFMLKTSLFLNAALYTEFCLHITVKTSTNILQEMCVCASANDVQINKTIHSCAHDYNSIRLCASGKGFLSFSFHRFKCSTFSSDSFFAIKHLMACHTDVTFKAEALLQWYTIANKASCVNSFLHFEFFFCSLLIKEN